MEPEPRYLGLARGSEYECDRLTLIVLTVAHLDQRKRNNTRGNLRGLCQRAHLQLDRPHHIAKRKAARRAKLACGDLLEKA
jgi:hypothetical protein